MTKKRTAGLLCLLILVSTVIVVLGMTTGREKGSHRLQQFASSIPDGRQFLDDSVPVAVFRVTMNAEPGKPYKAEQGILENRSSKNVEAVTLRWSLTTMRDRETVLQRGVMETIKLKAAKKSFRAHSRQTLKFPTPSLRQMMKLAANVDMPSENFLITIGVSEVLFEDGSTWKEAEQSSASSARALQKQRAGEALELAHSPPARPTPTPTCNKTVCKIELDANGDATGFLVCEDDDQPTVSTSECYYVGTACNNSACARSSLPDNDNDGYDNSVDCKDNDYYINPGVIENCGDAIDNNCDNLVDCADSNCSLEPACQPTPSPTPDDENCGPNASILESECYQEAGRWLPYPECRCEYSFQHDPGSPILIDVAGNGFNLTGVAAGVRFDLDADGTPEQLAWTAPNSDDAFLVLDRNGNGTIDNGAELFGNFTPQPAAAAPHGFRALAEYDKTTNGGNRDGVINNVDAIFSTLRLWQDANHNGISEAIELRALPSLDVTAINLDYKESKRLDEQGNRFRYRAKVYDRRGARVGRWAWDVFLRRQ